MKQVKTYLLLVIFLLLLSGCQNNTVSCQEGTVLIDGQCTVDIEDQVEDTIEFCDTTLSSYEVDSTYQLVWNDEFDYEGKLNEEKWVYQIGNGGLYGLPGWGNDEKQYYSDTLNNVSVSEGLLTITASTEGFAQYEYTSGRVRTQNKADFTYGIFEICASMPTELGTWPAIWMLPSDSPYGGWPYGGEIDIMEAVGFEDDIVHYSIHTKAQNWGDNQSFGTHSSIDDIGNTFHRYAIQWLPDSITFYVDGVKQVTYNPQDINDPNHWPFDTDFHLLLNVAVGGKWGGQRGIKEGDWTSSMKVDYVRVFQKIDD